MLTGTSNNTFQGALSLSGTSAAKSINLAKTGGALAIPANGVINFPSGCQASLLMGDNTTTGSGRSAWNSQIGSGTVANFLGTSTNYGRLVLQGTTQTLSGINAGTTSTLFGAIVENQGLAGFASGQDGTLILNGSGAYVYNGYFRNQDNGGSTNKLNLTWSGSGSQTLAGSVITHTGTTTVNSGIMYLFNTTAWNSPIVINSGGSLIEDGNASVAYGSSAALTINGGTYTHATTAASAWSVWNSSGGLLTIGTGGGTIITSNTSTSDNNVFFDNGITGSGALVVQSTAGGSGSTQGGIVI